MQTDIKIVTIIKKNTWIHLIVWKQMINSK